jgi:hypothetical protein
MVEYLKTPIVESRRTETPRYGIAADGYTLRSGAPTSLMVRLDGETRFRRLMVWQFSNAGTAFVRIKGTPYVVNEYDIPEPKE